VLDKWNELEFALEKMRKRIQKSLTPEAELLRARDYISVLRGPKYVSHESEKPLTDPAMENETTRVSVGRREGGERERERGLAR
jgi:hypothetical protein